MYVKVIYLGFGMFPCDTLIECDEVHYMQRSDNDNVVDITMKKDGKEVSLWAIDKKDYEVFVMNSDGKTIETLRWAGNRREQQKQ